ncbi:MAG: glycosyltransferase family 9 protein [Myxococcota bacterium]|nr:glycosyltransferase family 9 protein [Myxococcota bacterium]
MSTYVLRLSSLGDVVLAGSVTGPLARKQGEGLRFVTRARYAEIAAALEGVESVVRYELDGLPRGRDHQVVDLHASPRSRAWCLRSGARVSRVRRFDMRRRIRVWAKWGAPPPLVVERYALAAGVEPAPAPWIRVKGSADALLICPGASRSTKCWSIEGFAAIARRWDGPVVVLGSEREAQRVAAVSEQAGEHVEQVVENGFQRTLSALGRGRLALAGDTGLMHLCAAAGLPVVGLFGPTTSTDGFWSHGGRVVERALPCRPCSLHGREVCPVGDHMCMSALDVDTVWSAVQAAG